MSYCGGMPLWVKRVLPDFSWFSSIVDAVLVFEDRAAEATASYLAAVDGLPLTERTTDYAEIEC